jgi:hypothetical protein
MEEEDHREMAHAARVAYHPEHAPHLETQYGWRMVSPGAGNHVVFERQKPNGVKEALISFAGTRLSKEHRSKDLLTDAAVFLGLERLTKRYKESERATKQLIEQYGADHVRATGHSLGAHQAAHMSRRYGIRADAFSPPISLIDLRTHHKEALFAHPESKKTVFHVVRKDPISIAHLGLRFGVRQHKQKRRNPHSLKNFLDL